MVIRSLLIRSFAHLLKSNERLWANRSGHDKWANELFAQKMLAKKSKILFFSMFYTGFLFKKMSVSLIPSF